MITVLPWIRLSSYSSATFINLWLSYFWMCRSSLRSFSTLRIPPTSSCTCLLPSRVCRSHSPGYHLCLYVSLGSGHCTTRARRTLTQNLCRCSLVARGVARLSQLCQHRVALALSGCLIDVNVARTSPRRSRSPAVSPSDMLHPTTHLIAYCAANTRGRPTSLTQELRATYVPTLSAANAMHLFSMRARTAARTRSVPLAATCKAHDTPQALFKTLSSFEEVIADICRMRFIGLHFGVVLVVLGRRRLSTGVLVSVCYAYLIRYLCFSLKLGALDPVASRA